jgi:hypothetical protein
MDVGIAQGGEPISQPAQRVAVDEREVIERPTAHPSFRAIGTPQLAGLAAYAGNALSGSSALPPRREANWRRFIQCSRFVPRRFFHSVQPRRKRFDDCS